MLNLVLIMVLTNVNSKLTYSNIHDFYHLSTNIKAHYPPNLLGITLVKIFFFQFNNQINNVNINTRFQWRFAPVSDLFIVYTDNYYSETFKVKNRALVIKLNYWLNL